MTTVNYTDPAFPRKNIQMSSAYLNVLIFAILSKITNEAWMENDSEIYMQKKAKLYPRVVHDK